MLVHGSSCVVLAPNQLPRRNPSWPFVRVTLGRKAHSAEQVCAHQFTGTRAEAVGHQRNVKASAASLQTSQAPSDLEPYPPADNPLLQLPPAQPLHLDLQQGALKAGEYVILQGMSQELYISQQLDHGIVLGCQSRDGAAYSMIDTNLGQLRCERFLAAARCKLWWMTPEWGTRAAHLPPETQFLLLKLPEDCYAIVLPLIAGNTYRSTLRPPR
ncbi:hypothetical protein WJX74_007030 [Apatococcus lobatus]|uniref:Uncharacterized protein n=1 Tax=Apatococcus lobatus TaxID=904363 RepID=A0AAW1RZ46_9CHLO